MIHRFHLWVYHNLEVTSGLLSGTIMVQPFLDFGRTLIQSLIVALLSGAVGAYGAHLFKKYILKQDKNENTQDL